MGKPTLSAPAVEVRPLSPRWPRRVLGADESPEKEHPKEHPKDFEKFVYGIETSLSFKPRFRIKRPKFERNKLRKEGKQLILP